jgi:hypothetical protein
MSLARSHLMPSFTKKFNHAFSLEFSVDTDNEDYPTEREILHALAGRFPGILDPTSHPSRGTLLSELKHELVGVTVAYRPHDTYQEENV